MLNKSISLVFMIPLLALAASSDQSEQKKDHTYVEQEDEDVWFGPGYYYGTWFDDEDDYWEWRGNHDNYPPNRDYYSHDHPIRYSPEGHEEEGRGGAGGRGGGRK